MKRIALVLSVVFCLIFFSTAVFAGNPNGNKSFGQTVFVPAAYNFYPNLYQFLISRIVIRNVDPEKKITVTSLAFYDPDGTFVKEFLGADLDIESWSSKTYASNPSTIQLPLYPHDGGRPCFIVKWEAEERVIPPMIGSGISVWDSVAQELMSITSSGGKVIE